MTDRSHLRWTPELSLMEFAAPHQTEPSEDRWWLEGGSAALTRLHQRAQAVALTGFSAVVVAGEPGSGKHRVARWLHQHSDRGSRPLAQLDAAQAGIGEAVDNLLSAQPGNLIVHNLQRAQRALIARLQGLLTPSTSAPNAVCGLLLLTTETVAELRARSLEHEQLIGRSTSALLELPPLRKRREDIAPLARTFLNEAAARYNRTPRGLSPQAIALLEEHDFRGNLRELRSIIEQAVLHSNGDWLTVDDLALRHTRTPDEAGSELIIRLPGSSLREIELQAIRLSLKIAGGRLVRAAELLGITRHALRRKLEKYGLDNLRQRPGRPPPEPEDTPPSTTPDDAYI